MTERRPSVHVASGILHPVVLASIAMLVLNDHWLKATWGHPVTGKLSDVAGLLFFPLLLVALVEVAQALGGRYRGPSRRALLLATMATGVVFTLVQVSLPATEAYRVGLGGMQHPAAVVEALASGEGLAAVPKVHVTPDVTDLPALPALCVAYAIGRRRAQRPERLSISSSTRRGLRSIPG